MSELWRRWRMEYLRFLRISSKYHSSVPISVDDIVLVEEDSKKELWPIARVTNLLPGVDGNVRSAEVLRKGKVYKRPIQKLYKLEID